MLSRGSSRWRQRPEEAAEAAVSTVVVAVVTAGGGNKSRYQSGVAGGADEDTSLGRLQFG